MSLLAALAVLATPLRAQVQGETLLLRQPTLSAGHVAFVYGADLWIVQQTGGEARRLTSTPAVEADPRFSPDGTQIAFTSNRSGVEAVYVVPVEGGEPKRLTWYPASSRARGWTPDGSRVLYASSRQTAPGGYERLWTVSPEGGPSTLLPAPMGTRASYAPDGGRIVIDRISRWDEEWRGYRGGQNTPLVILELEGLAEILIPNDRTTDIHPVWHGEVVYFLSDRDGVMNIWSFAPSSGQVTQHTQFTGADTKWLSGGSDRLVFEREGALHTFDPSNGQVETLSIVVPGDFPWAEARWQAVGDRVTSSTLSPTGKRALFGARGEIFTVPAKDGDVRNLTKSPDAADRAPTWSPDGQHIAWFSDAGGEGYGLLIAQQDGLGAPRHIPIGESKMAWEPVWSPDGAYIAFVDNAVRIRVVDVARGTIRTAGTGGINIERGRMGIAWSPDSKWLAYAKTAPNQFRRVLVWSMESGDTHALSDPLADAYSPAWDRDGRHLYFLASTDIALGSGWANTSAMQAEPEYGAYVVVLRKEDASPLAPKSDEEPDKAKKEEKGDSKPKDEKTDKAETDKDEAEKVEPVLIDFDRIDRRTLALPMPVRRYAGATAGPKGSVFFGERVSGAPGMTLHKFTLEERESEVFVSGVSQVSVSADGQKMLFLSGGTWRIVDTGQKPGDENGTLAVDLRMHLDRAAEWKQMFDEAWRYERDYFYDPGMHGRDWDEVYERYVPLLPYVRHREDLTYLLDQMNGELSVGHSFVFGGDYPDVDTVRVGLLGADLEAENGRWRIKRIYSAESWNPGLTAPLDRPGIKVEPGHYLVGVDGVGLTAADDPYRLLDGTEGRQTVLQINDNPSMEGAWMEIVTPIRSEGALRQRAWVEDNRRRVDELSGGRLAYVWVPNTSGSGVVSFDRYYFAQQDKEGAVIDERFNGGGLLDDYMVDLMTRRLRAAITNEVPNGAPFRLPAGILGPKVLLINELAGSGGDFFPWVFRQQKAGPLIGTRTWGGVVKSSVHYPLVDGGALTAPDNAVFDPINNRWIGENEGIAPDIEVRVDARSVANGRDPQLERAVAEALRLIDEEGVHEVTPPPFSTPARGAGGQR